MTFELEFQGAWRDYQQRVLDELAGHLSDQRLNVVAAPGSGKTVLGLEVMCRIGRPALILAPTIAIRNQWVDRLSQFFRPPGAVPADWISTSLGSPRKLTISTYQALHATSEAEDDAAD
jgi:superfamily II DNA or RNA helicase